MIILPLGVYVAVNGTITGTLSNCPISSYAFKLIVEHINGTGRIRQTIYANLLTCDTYVRYNNGSWGDWGRIITTTKPDDTVYINGSAGSAPNYATGTYNIAKSGKIVNLVLQLTVQANSGISGSDGNVCIMGSTTLNGLGLKPKIEVHTVCQYLGKTNYGTAWIETGGNVMMRAGTTIPKNQVFQIDFTYVTT